ncbi:hypothetical protein ACWGMO_13390, partial [Nocardia salmonicida]
ADAAADPVARFADPLAEPDAEPEPGSAAAVPAEPSRPIVTTAPTAAARTAYSLDVSRPDNIR